MAYFDLLAGITQSTANALLQQFYSTAPDSPDNPFNGTTQQDVDRLGTVTLQWKFASDVTVLFTTPSQDDWNNALGPTGETNSSTGTPLPTGPMVQLTTSMFQAGYNTDTNPKPVTGTADLSVYAVITAASGQTTLSTVAVLFKNSVGFNTWNQSVFTGLLVPQLFSCGDTITQVVQFPPFVVPAIRQNPWTVEILHDSLLIGATTLPGNGPVALADFTPPPASVFFLISPDVINTMASQFGELFDDVPFGGASQYQVNGKTLANCTLDGTISVPKPFSVASINPLVCEGSVAIGGSATLDVTPDGLGYGGVTGGGGGGGGGNDNCPLIPWLTFPPPVFRQTFKQARKYGFQSLSDSTDETFNYTLGSTPSPLQVVIAAKLDDSSLTLTATSLNNFDFTYAANNGNPQVLGKLQSSVLDPSTGMLSKEYKPAVSAAIVGQYRGVLINNSLAIGNSNQLIAGGLTFGQPVFMLDKFYALQINCTLSVVVLPFLAIVRSKYSSQ